MLKKLTALILFWLRKKPCFSTGICGSLTCGYGKLSCYGYWEYPVPRKYAARRYPEVYAYRAYHEDCIGSARDHRETMARLEALKNWR